MLPESEHRRALAWFAGHDTGASSKAICLHMMGHRHTRADYPLDPSDLGRCLRLLALIPEWKPRLPEMAAYGPQWAGLVQRWSVLEAFMAEEVGIDWSRGRSAPMTYDAMQSAMGPR